MKYLKKKIIRGRPYYYLEFSLTVQGKKCLYSHYLGAAFPQDAKMQLASFFEKTAVEIAGIITQDYFFQQTLHDIERSKLKYLLLHHDLFRSDLEQFQTLFYVLFVLNSNRSEGSKVTRPEIEEVITRKVKPRTLIEIEIINSIDAINFSLSKEMRWNHKSIKKIHQLLFNNLSPAGQYKSVNNVMSNMPTTPWQNVQKEMSALLRWMKRQKKKMYHPQLALEFHWHFESIHPFEDGNGRVGRILLNAILLELGYAPVIFFSENHQAYCHALAKARAGNCRPLAKHFVESVKKTARNIERYRREGIIRGGSPKVGRWEIEKGKIRLG
ncbi:Fic family protein [Candidatus Woesearchaeota archaeon]|nr:Fic family protein [Candidatus Woesearchaeota archaeon]